MKRPLLRNCILTASVLILPGCLAINALLGVAGIMGSGPLQYAGTVYSVGEYTYEYAVNDRTPDEVIEHKLAWLLPEEQPETPLPSQPQIHYADTADDLKMTAKAEPASRPPLPRISGRETNPVEVPPIIVASAPAIQQITPTSPSPKRIRPVQIRRKTSGHTYIERTPDPLQQKLARLNQTLRLAEQMAAREPASGIRCSVSSESPGQTHGINGSWSIRHTVMQHAPAPGPMTERTTEIQNTPPVQGT
ncbi:hypothetical protein [uncultured Pseudodesulfovibrio sp.]|uniref:hypothetical protein n=1 Tax=uncultured Pseudodesulfovibrio sp. TaxID=2035858 RepID=UPI0029C97624|nr:hypothetical protein [uncultured Pseudodesulfovibrio sp.]